MDGKTPDSENKLSDTVNNICTVLGAAMLLYPLIDHAAKNVLPEIAKLASGETPDGMKLLPQSTEEVKAEPESKPEPESDDGSDPNC